MKPPFRQPGRHVALLRGINVGGKNMLPMKELVKMFAAAGGENVQTYIQSGNVVFEATDDVSADLQKLVTRQIAKKFGCEIPIVLRTMRELEAVVSSNPFLKANVPEEHLHVMFLADLPESANVAKLDPARSSPDEFMVRGREVFLKLPNGGGRSKLTNAWFDSKLATVSTVRNWRTINKLLEMMK